MSCRDAARLPATTLPASWRPPGQSYSTSATGSSIPPPSSRLDAEGGGTERRGFFKRLRASLATSREALGAEISSSLFETLDTETWERLEEALIMADVGARTTADVVGRLEGEVDSGRIEGADAVRARLIELLAELATGDGNTRIDLRPRPAVVLIVGVNGTGKTTTVGKLAWHLSREAGLSVMVAAADTYRAAAVEQLTTWAERAGCDIVKAETGQDAGAVVFDAIAAAKARGTDVVLIDTAGRLHNRADLMEELAKVNRVILKQNGAPPSETLIVVDSTTGQNGLRQAKVFSEAVDGLRRGADEAGRHRQGRDRARDRRRDGDPGEADRGRRGDRGPAPVRRRGVLRRPSGRVKMTPGKSSASRPVSPAP